jgi:arabinogalactan oligomer / maltooligosaccharide transport system substrate-binding protein
MKRIAIAAIALCLVAGMAFGQAANKAQWDAAKKQYKIEPGAKITLGVDPSPIGVALVALWDKVHPEAKGAVEFVNTGAAGEAKKIADLQGDAPDVVAIITDEAIPYSGALAAIDSNLVKVAADNIDASFYKAANAMYDSPRVLPFSYDGMAFAWNKTMLTKLGLIKGQVTKDNLPVEFDTWEKIFALSNAWAKNRPTYNGKPVQIVFPVSLQEPWSGYSTACTSAGWEIFKAGDPLKPGFEDPKFAQGLQFLVEAAKAKLSTEADGSLTPGASMAWRWDPVLNDQSAPFGLVGTWMDVAGATAKGGHDMQFAPMPTYKGNRLTPYLKVKSWAINAYSKYPSAAAELLRLFYTKEGMQTLIDNSAYVPSLKAGSKIAPDYSKDLVKKQMAYAFQFSYTEPVTLALPGNTAKQAAQVYYNIGMNQFYADIWDGKLTPADAAAKI